MSRECTYCGKTDAAVRQYDAANALHWFHPRCLSAFLKWLTAPVPPRLAGTASRTKGRRRGAAKLA